MNVFNWIRNHLCCRRRQQYCSDIYLYAEPTCFGLRQKRYTDIYEYSEEGSTIGPPLKRPLLMVEVFTDATITVWKRALEETQLPLKARVLEWLEDNEHSIPEEHYYPFDV